MHSSSYTLEQLGLQISRLNSFYDAKIDGSAVIELGKAIIAVRSQVLQKCFSEADWALRIRLFLRKAFGSLHSGSNVPHAVCIRILEVRLTNLSF